MLLESLKVNSYNYKGVVSILAFFIILSFAYCPIQIIIRSERKRLVKKWPGAHGRDIDFEAAACREYNSLQASCSVTTMLLLHICN